MADYKNRYPTVPPINFESSDPSEAAKADNGVKQWVSHRNPEETCGIAASEHFKAIGNLPKRKSLNADEGTIETVKGQDQ